jgi:hypothetical protein
LKIFELKGGVSAPKKIAAARLNVVFEDEGNQPTGQFIESIGQFWKKSSIKLDRQPIVGTGFPVYKKDLSGA